MEIEGVTYTSEALIDVKKQLLSGKINIQESQGKR